MGVIACLAVNGSNPVTVSGTGTGAQYFPNIPGASIGVAGTSKGTVAMPGGNMLNAQFFTVQASGTVTAGTPTSPTILIELVAIQGSTITVLANLHAAETLSPSINSWGISVDLIGDTTSGVLGGSYEGYINGVLSTGVTTTPSVLAGVNFASFGNVLFAARVTFGTGEAGNSASLYQLAVCQS